MFEIYPQHSGLDPKLTELIDDMKSWEWLINHIPGVRCLSKLFPHEATPEDVEIAEGDLLPTNTRLTLEE